MINATQILHIDSTPKPVISVISTMIMFGRIGRKNTAHGNIHRVVRDGISYSLGTFKYIFGYFYRLKMLICCLKSAVINTNITESFNTNTRNVYFNTTFN